MSLQSKDITEERFMGLAGALKRTLWVQQYLLDQIKLSNDAPHKEHIKLQEMRGNLYKASEALEVYFFGD